MNEEKNWWERSTKQDTSLALSLEQGCKISIYGLNWGKGLHDPAAQPYLNFGSPLTPQRFRMLGQICCLGKGVLLYLTQKLFPTLPYITTQDQWCSGRTLTYMYSILWLLLTSIKGSQSDLASHGLTGSAETFPEKTNKKIKEWMEEDEVALRKRASKNVAHTQHCFTVWFSEVWTPRIISRVFTMFWRKHQPNVRWINHKL